MLIHNLGGQKSVIAFFASASLFKYIFFVKFILVYNQVWGRTGLPDVRIPILTVLGLGHEKDNSRQEKRDKVEFHNSAGGP